MTIVLSKHPSRMLELDDDLFGLFGINDTMYAEVRHNPANTDFYVDLCQNNDDVPGGVELLEHVKLKDVVELIEYLDRVLDEVP